MISSGIDFTEINTSLITEGVLAFFVIIFGILGYQIWATDNKAKKGMLISMICLVLIIMIITFVIILPTYFGGNS